MNTAEAEVSVLSLVLEQPDWVPHEALELLHPDDFEDARHRCLFVAVADLVEDGMAVDVATLADRLRDHGTFEMAGGLGYIGGLIGVGAFDDHLGDYCQLIRKAAYGRRLQAVITDAGRRLIAGELPTKVADGLDNKLLALEDGAKRSTMATSKEAADEALAAIRLAVETEGESRGLPWGIKALDENLRLSAGDLTILAARPSQGKTALAMQAGVENGRAGAKVAFWSLEMPKAQLAMRAICGIARVSLHRARTGQVSPTDMRDLEHGRDIFSALPIAVDDDPAVTIQGLRSRARKLKRRQGLDLVIVDYLQLMTSSDDADNRNLEVGQISRGLKILAKELDVPVLALSQLSRGPEHRPDKRPMMSDLRDSGAIEQDADNIVFVFRPELYMDEMEARQKGLDGKANLIVAKQRNGPVGSVGCAFDKETVRFISKGGQSLDPDDYATRSGT